jgi:phospholipase D1/2
MAYLKRKKKLLIRLMIGIVLLLGMILALRLTPLRQYTTVQQLVSWVEIARVNPGAIIIFYMAFVLAVLALPITIFPIVGGVLLGFWPALLCNSLAATAGAFLAFVMARYFGRGFIETMLKGKLKSWDKNLAKKGLWAIVAIRIIGIPPFILMNYGFGLSRIKIRHFLLGTYLGILPWLTLVTYLSHNLWNAIITNGDKGLFHAVSVNLRPLGILSMTILLTAGLTYLLKRRKGFLAPTGAH